MNKIIKTKLQDKCYEKAKFSLKELESKLSELPKCPGCYLFSDNNGSLLYVGKSKNINIRVKSYFRDSHSHTPRINLMTRQIREIEVIITDTEDEALTLESNLIKEHQPHFNVLLKDDKKYPYVCITWSEEYPRLYITRRRRNRSEKDRYYGPYVDVGFLRNTLFLIKKVFPLRQRNTPLYKDRVCLNYSIGRCPGVCQEYISSKEYRETIKKVAMVFQGRSDELHELLTRQMVIYSDQMEYEKAASIRDQIKSLKQLGQNQKMILPDSAINRDVIAMSNKENIVAVQLFQMRSGKLVGRLGFNYDINNFKLDFILQKVIEEYYSHIDPVEIPKEILLQNDIPQKSIISEWLSDLKKSKVIVNSPKKGQKLEIIKLVQKNADLELINLTKLKAKNNEALEDLCDIIELSNIPKRVEAYDISHIQGSNVVASQVVFIDGLPAKQHYRRYKIKSQSIHSGHSDDYMALAETIRRRFRKWSQAKKSGFNINNLNIENNSTLHTQGLNDWPDLILIDGGKGQLSTVVNVIRSMDLQEELNICSLAKKQEHLFIPNVNKPVATEINQPGMILLRSLRDEAHRFAINYHRKLRRNQMKRSRLSEIPGIGNKMIKELLNHFQSVEAIQLATLEDLSKVNGLGSKKSKMIWSYFHPNNLN